ncbi:Leucine aminopeptidase 2 [Arachis hypogaea]|nr:Leucine aminopeptidase 2 [Arachis hypogaea]
MGSEELDIPFVKFQGIARHVVPIFTGFSVRGLEQLAIESLHAVVSALVVVSPIAARTRSPVAAVLGAAKALGQIKPLGVEVHFVVAACKNMINGKGMRLGDIVTTSNRKTIEVNNTDAEGRLTLLCNRNSVLCCKWFGLI